MGTSLSRRLGVLLVPFLFCLSHRGLAGPPYMEESFDSRMVLGMEQCQKCHAEQVRVLQQHAHHTHARPMQRQPPALSMVRQLGGRTVKRSDRCIRCHYTPQATERGERAISAISCESCHGPSRDWLLVHNDYGGPDATKESESMDHRTQRITGSIQRGMRHPAHLYTLARRCFRCHIIDDEELVNVAGHPFRSGQFEMVSWSQGSMRHNFLRTGGSFNAVSDPVRLRTMFVVGLLADLEFSLRAIAKSTAGGTYRSSHQQHYQALQQQLFAVQQKLRDTRLQTVMDQLAAREICEDNPQGISSMADRISRVAWEFALQPGSDLQAIESMTPSESRFRGTPVR